MNRRTFFGVVGASVAAAVLGKKVDADPFHVRVFQADSVRTSEGFIAWPHESYSIDAGYGIDLNPGLIMRTDGVPLLTGDLYFDADGVIQLRPQENGPLDDSWFDAWL